SLARDEVPLEEAVARFRRCLDDEVVMVDAEPLRELACDPGVVAGLVERGAAPPRDALQAPVAAPRTAQRKQQAAAVCAARERHDPARVVELEPRGDLVDDRLEPAAALER